MPKPNKQSEVSPRQDTSITLIDAVRSLTDQLETLAHEVGTLAGRAQILTDAIDDVRCELEWTIRNLHYSPPRLISNGPQEHDVRVNDLAPAKPPQEKSNGPATAHQRELRE